MLFYSFNQSANTIFEYPRSAVILERVAKGFMTPRKVVGVVVRITRPSTQLIPEHNKQNLLVLTAIVGSSHLKFIRQVDCRDYVRSGRRPRLWGWGSFEFFPLQNETNLDLNVGDGGGQKNLKHVCIKIGIEDSSISISEFSITRWEHKIFNEIKKKLGNKTT